MAFHDINKQAPTHFLVIPKEPIQQLSNCTSSHEKVNRISKYFFIELLFSFDLATWSFVICCYASC